MSLHKDYEDQNPFSDYPHEEEPAEDLNRKKYLRRKIEDRLERKRLKEEFDELDGEFDWDELDR